jgi:hypothetical protein
LAILPSLLIPYLLEIKRLAEALLPSWLEAFKVVVAYFWVTCDPKTYEFGPHIATYEDQILNIFITG